ncbi:MAG: MauE/DoxX family redox-associated membrane protein [Phycisphaerales bacterium]
MEKARIALRWVSLLLLVLTGLLLLVGGLWKIQHASEFASVLLSHERIAPSDVPTLARVVAWGEALSGLGCLIAVALGSSRSGAAMAAVVFAVLAGYSMWMHESPPSQHVPCGCGAGRAVVLNWAVISLRNAGVGAGMAIVAFMNPNIPLSGLRHS